MACSLGYFSAIPVVFKARTTIKPHELLCVFLNPDDVTPHCKKTVPVHRLPNWDIAKAVL